MRWAAPLAVLLASLPAAAYTPPPIAGHITDVAGKLSPDQVADLDHRLHLFRSATGFEIAVLLVPSLNGETIEDVAFGTFHTWQLGEKGKDNGVLLVIAPAERRVRIETGKGVEGSLTDLQSNDIIRQRIGPFLKQDRFYEGILAGTGAIEHDLAPSYANASPPPPPVGMGQPPLHGPPPPPSSSGIELPPLCCLILLVVGILFARRFFFGGGGGFFWGGGGGFGGGDGGGFGGGGGGDGFSGGGGGDSGGGGSSDSY